jgi:hypothetical protein
VIIRQELNKKTEVKEVKLKNVSNKFLLILKILLLLKD